MYGQISRKIAAAIVIVGLCWTGMASAQTIVGSDHDFSNDGWSGGQICLVCHTPHNAATGVSDAPLWNHMLTSSVFNLYTNTTLNATPNQPTGVSLLCLSCHDGTVALDSFGGNTGNTFIGGGENFGTDLSNDHPIAISYAADTTLAPDTNPSGVTGGTTIAADLLFSGNVECASCHDVHNSSGEAKLLVKSNDASALCQTCHIK